MRCNSTPHRLHTPSTLSHSPLPRAHIHTRARTNNNDSSPSDTPPSSSPILDLFPFPPLAMYAVACSVQNANHQPGTACQCLPGFKGKITWSGDTYTGNCTATKCTDFVDQVVNGTVEKSNGDLHDSVANFYCNDGFKLTGMSTITCSAPSTDTLWPKAPSCMGMLLR